MKLRNSLVKTNQVVNNRELTTSFNQSVLSITYNGIKEKGVIPNTAIEWNEEAKELR